ncbi:MAG: DCC1-like thiol-disulfide oxidoreductase family protein [Rhodomicrobium sp.]
MPRRMTLGSFVRERVAAFDEVWSQIWFQPAPTTPLEIARIGLGAALLFHFAMATPYLFDFWGDTGFVPRAVVPGDNPDAWVQSVFFYFTAPWQWAAFHVLFLACCAAFMVGWRTSWVKWIVLIGQISYDRRDPAVTYGVDWILASTLLILCLAPIGQAMSLDRVRALRAAKRNNLGATLPLYRSPWTGACTRLIQIQMAVIFFYSAVTKLARSEWIDGSAVWVVFTMDEHYSPAILHLLASQYWLVEVGTYGTIFLELAFTFLIWQRSTRPYLLADALVLHALFAVMMGLYYFSFVMVMGHMSFVRPEWITRLGLAWKRKMGGMEMIYDGRCGFCVRSMAWFLAFDGLGQIKARDFRTNPSPVVSDANMEKALYLVLPDGRALPGFEAYRYVVLRVPGLWWQIPFFYVPVFSRLIGTPIYNWVAGNRSWLSSVLLRPRQT